MGAIASIPSAVSCFSFPGVSGYSRLASSQSRPISHGDRTTIESQLARHQRQEQHQAKTTPLGPGKRQDLLDADPWENSIPHTTPVKQPSTPSAAPDDFYSLDLESSLSSSAVSERTGMEDSFASATSRLLRPVRGVELGARGSVHRRRLEGDDDLDVVIDLHGGVGLQQLSQSPAPLKPQRSPASPSPRSSPFLPHKPSTHQPKPGPHPSCKCTLTLSGLTVALLEADPSHTYTSCQPGHSMGSGGEASMDEGGLDPVKYFELVSEQLKDGVNRHQLALHQEQLAQILPVDHLM